MILLDDAAFTFLKGPDTVRDDLLVRVEFVEASHDDPPVVTMEFVAGDGRTSRHLRLVFREVIEFGFYFRTNKPRAVGMFKCLKTEAGDFFVSLDPHDEREPTPSEQDGDFVRAQHIELMVNFSE